MKTVSPVIEAHDFAPHNFVGGDAALDFVNTVTGRDETPRDWLDGYPRLLEWAEKVQLLPPVALRALSRKASADAAKAAHALKHAKQLREALFAITTALIAGKAPPESALMLLNEQWQAGAAAHALRHEKHELQLLLRDDTYDLDLIASLIAWRFVEHVLPEPRDRLRLCAGNNCGWLFLDRSKAGRRRWCDMAVCGNTAKSRRFQARARKPRANPKRG